MEVFTIDFSLNLMLHLVVLTHVTTRNSESTDSSILNLLHINTLVYDFEISTQRFRSSAIVDLVCSNLSPPIYAILLIIIFGSPIEKRSPTTRVEKG